MKQKHSNRKIIDIRSSQEESEKCNNKKSIFFSETGLERDVRTCINIERNKLQNFDKITAKKIVSHAQGKLLMLLKSKQTVACLKEKQNSQHFHLGIVRPTHQRSSLFDEDKLQRQLSSKKRKYRQKSHQFISPLIQFCQRQTQNNEKSYKKIKSSKPNPKQYVRLSSCQKHRRNILF